MLRQLLDVVKEREQLPKRRRSRRILRGGASPLVVFGETAVRFQGRITDWRDDKGFGFITPNGGGDHVFFHIKAFARSSRRPCLNDRVNYTLGRDEQGRPRAARVEFVGKPRVPATGRKPSRVLIAVPPAFLVIIAALVVAGQLPGIVGIAYAFMSLVAFVAYAIDKAAARADRWRTQESTLHLLGVVGGWPGGLLAQQLLRHKSKKSSFLVVFWVSVVVNLTGLLWLMSPAGRGFLGAISGGIG